MPSACSAPSSRASTARWRAAGGRRSVGVGVTSFWHGLLGFDAAGRPATPIYTWADTRAARDADLLRHALDEDRVHARTGCHLHACYWPAKLRWLAHDQPAMLRRVTRWGSIGEYLEQTFFGEAATSISMASATGLFDQRALAWDAETLAAAGIDERQLFPLCDRGDGRRGLRAPWARRWPALAGATWFPALGDGATSTVGSDCLDPTRIALNVGTSAAMRFVAEEPLAAPARTLELSRRSASGRSWAARPRRAATSMPGSGVSCIFPATTRWRPRWPRRSPTRTGSPCCPSSPASARRDGEASAGRRYPDSRSIRRPSRSCAPGSRPWPCVWRRVYELLGPLAAPHHTLIASGGALRSRAWAHMIADALGRPLSLSPEEEATSRGCALLALQSLGRLRDLRGGPGSTRQDRGARSSPARPVPRRARNVNAAWMRGYDRPVTTQPRITVAETPAALAETAARLIVETAREAVAARGRFTIALAGGATPRETYARLSHPPLRESMPWDRTWVFFGDERAVPPDHRESNYRMAHEALLSAVPLPLAHSLSVCGRRPRIRTPRRTSTRRPCSRSSAQSPGELPRFDLVLLGLGIDGHTASLFPNSTALKETVRWVVSVHAAAAAIPRRLTMTLPVINAARCVTFLSAGSEKAKVVRTVLKAVRPVLVDAPPLPAAMVRPHRGSLEWLLDRAAASLLDT